MLFSVCIPAYNRVEYLPELLESILSQQFYDFEIVLCEDASPQRKQIKAVVEEYIAQYGADKINYIENEKNLGFDANFRTMIRASRGDFCVIMGNDDVMLPCALKYYADILLRHPNSGVVLRSFVTFAGSLENVLQVHRFWATETYFAPGDDAVVNFYPKLVAMAGLVLNRDACLQVETDIYDGTLFYQMYLALKVLPLKGGVAVPDVTVAVRKGILPDFGVNEKEKSGFIPGERGASFDVELNRSIIAIARAELYTIKPKLFKRILKSLGDSSYSALAHQAHLPLRQFFSYYKELRDLGLGESKWLSRYFLLLSIFGTTKLNVVVRFVKKLLGHTPRIGNA